MELDDFKSKLTGTESFFAEEVKDLRTGRANASLVEDILVTAYEGSPPLTVKELATIGAPEPQLLLVTPWDQSIIATIGTAIRRANLGLNPIVDGGTIKVPIPTLTEERRNEYAKKVGEAAERAKVAARSIRNEAMRSLEEQKEAGILSEDDHFRLKKQFEEEVAEVTGRIDQRAKEKKEELLAF